MMSQRVALIIGITGQDGAYLARFLLMKGYAVHGTSRDAARARLDGLVALGIVRRYDFTRCFRATSGHWPSWSSLSLRMRFTISRASLPLHCHLLSPLRR